MCSCAQQIGPVGCTTSATCGVSRVANQSPCCCPSQDKQGAKTNEKGKRDQPKRSSSVSLSRRISHLATDRTQPTKKVRRPSNSIISFLPSFSPLMPEGAKAAAAAKSRGSEEWLAHKKQLRGNRGGRVGSGGAFRTEQRNKPKQTSKLQIYL